jgi:hypothetical protein
MTVLCHLLPQDWYTADVGYSVPTLFRLPISESIEAAYATGRAESQAEIDQLKRVIHAFEVGIGGLVMAIGEVGEGVKKAKASQ